jgi:hypothetical protein
MGNDLMRVHALLLLASAVVVTSAACGDDDDSSGATTQTSTEETAVALSDYFMELDEIFEEADRNTEQAQTIIASVPTGAPLQNRVAALDDFLSETERIFDRAVERLEELDAPPEVSEDHEEFLDAVHDASIIAAGLQDRLPEVASEADAEDLVTEFDEELAPVLASADDACFSLQEVADSNDIDVNLSCDD